MNTDGPEVLANLNRLAGTAQDSRPVNQTLEYFLERTGQRPIACLRQRMVQRLIRMKALDAARLQGRFVVLIDGSGYLVFRSRHCDHCLTQRHGETTLYMHQVLEAKLLGPAGTVVSIATEFIDNSDAQSVPAGASQEQIKQDCELKALRRLLAGLRAEFPQFRICLDGDGLYACGEGFQVAKDYKCDFIYVFKPGRLPALWQEFQGLLRLCPEPAGGVDDAAGGVPGLSLGQRPALHRQRWPRVDLRRLGVHRDEQGWKEECMVMGNVPGGQPRDRGRGGDRRREDTLARRRTRGLTPIPFVLAQPASL